MDIHRKSLMRAGDAGCRLDTPSELAARLTVARSTLAPQVPCSVWQMAYVRIGRYLDALGIDAAAHEALIQEVLAEAAGRSDDEFIAVALAALERRLGTGDEAPHPIAAALPSMPPIARSHMRPLPLRRRQLRDVWDRRLEPVAILVLRVFESFYRTLRLIAS